MSQLKTTVRRILFAAVASMAAAAARAQTYTVLHQFGNDVNGLNSLTIGSDGYLYGTTTTGGSGACPHSGIAPPYGCGTIFKMDSAGNLTTLHNFSGWLSQPNDGAFPSALTQASDGNFYGTTGAGGTSNNCGGFGSSGCGTVFKMDSSGNVTTLHNFELSDGRGGAPLVQATDGNFYGFTDVVGTNNNGAIYRMDTSGNLTILYNFSGSSDGSRPSGFVQASDGFLYGTTANGGSSGCFGLGCGTVFKMDLSGNLVTLRAFTGYPNDGAYPSGVIQAEDGNFYGTTGGGGNGPCATFQLNPEGCGTIFSMDSAGRVTTLHSFASGQDGVSPSSLIQGTDRNFYGTTYSGGSGECTDDATRTIGCGVLFKLDSTGSFSILYNFQPTDGVHPNAAVVQAADGSLYGSTPASGGGVYPAGAVIYRFSLPGTACIPDANTLCLGNGRFQVQVQWNNLNVYSGVASVVPGAVSNNSGVTWFFSPDNWELLIKVLDGCGVDGHYWVFGAAATNVGYTIQVTDTQTGEVRVYTNLWGTISPAITDTAAFPGCP